MGLIVDNLSKHYPTRSSTLSVLSSISFTLEKGQALVVMGPSGSGKSTLLQIIGTLDSPSSGTISLDGVSPFGLAEPALAAFRSRHVGFVFQDHHLLPQCNVLENVLIPTLVAEDGDRSRFEKEARQLLDRVGLSGRLDHRPAELSGGERQRAAIARALIRKPKLLLADEPTGNLDRVSAQGVGELLSELHRQEGTILMVVTHSAELADRFPNRAEMCDGRLKFRS